MKRKALWLRIGALLLPLLVVEVSLRLAGYPKGVFFFASDKNSSRVADFGVVPFTVPTNSLGYRGRDLASPRDRATTRIMAAGDSITYGFFVDDADTYPAALESSLISSGVSVEVLNIGRGNISIDKEYAITRKALDLHPDIVLLTFTTNDITDLRGKNRNHLVSSSAQLLTWRERLFKLLASTATGEFLFDASIGLIFESYGVSRRDDAPQGEDRYEIAGGNDYLANSEVFRGGFWDTDGLVLREPFPSEAEELVDNYLLVFEHMADFLATQKVRLVLAYSPAYSQIYKPGTSMKMRDILKEAAAEKGAEFLDLTPVLKNAGADAVLHLAPLDFHPNPAGNRVMGEAVAEFLLERGLVSTGP